MLTKTPGAKIEDTPSTIVVVACDELEARNCARSRFGRQVLWPSQFEITDIGTPNDMFVEAEVLS